MASPDKSKRREVKKAAARRAKRLAAASSKLPTLLFTLPHLSSLLSPHHPQLTHVPDAAAEPEPSPFAPATDKPLAMDVDVDTTAGELSPPLTLFRADSDSERYL